MNHNYWVASELSIDLQSLAHFIVDYGMYPIIANGEGQWTGIDSVGMVFRHSATHIVPSSRTGGITNMSNKFLSKDLKLKLLI